VPLLISSGTLIERRRVEFCPIMGGSGVRLMDVSVKRAPPLEQSLTLAPTEAHKARSDRIRANIFYRIMVKTL
jgi:hypothetical protein